LHPESEFIYNRETILRLLRLKVTRPRRMKEMGSGAPHHEDIWGMALCILDLALDGGKQSTSHSGHFSA
jgi:hypothetical protein